MRKFYGLLCILSLFLMAAACEEDKYPDLEDGIYAEINTTKGTMVAELFYKDAPLTVANYVALAEGEHEQLTDSLQGKPFYDGLIFHRVIEGFMIQGGDFTGTGGGSVGYKFNQEVQDSLKHDEKGILSMANAGPDTNGSQFFIMHEPNPRLDMSYNVFGKVVEGLAVVDSIATTPTGPRDKPLDSIVMNSVRIIRKGKEARKFDAVKTFVAEGEASEKRRVEKAEEDARIAKERAENAVGYIEKKAAQLAALKSQAKKLPGSEIEVYVKTEGSGEKPNEGDAVILDYAGYFEDGRLFDTSDFQTAENFDAINPRKLAMKMYESLNVPYSSRMGSIQGFKEAVLSMTYGEEIVAFIPSALAYGTTGNGPIPPNTDIVFEMKMSKPEADQDQD